MCIWKIYGDIICQKLREQNWDIIMKGFEGFEIVLLPCGNHFQALLGKSHSCKALS